MKKTKTKILAAMLVAASVIQFPINNVYASEVQETQDVSEGAKYLEEICSSEEDKIPNTTITDEQLSLMNDYSSVVNYYTDTTEYELGYKENISGIYCGEDEGIVVLTTDNDLTTVENEVDSLVSTDAVKIEHAEFSYNELLALQSAIQEQVNMSQNEDDLWARIADVSVDDKSNKVVVCVENISEEDKKAFNDAFDSDDKVILQNSVCEAMATAIKPGARIICDTEYYPGKRETNGYSVGCRAYRNLSNGRYQYGFITAGHGNSINDKVYLGYLSEETYIGKIVARAFGDSTDASFVALENTSKFNLSNNISYSRYTLSSGKYISSDMVGQICAFSGATTTQLLFGRIIDEKSGDFEYIEQRGMTLTTRKKSNLVIAKLNYDTQRGDSGGLLFAVVDDTPCVIGTLVSGPKNTKTSYYTNYSILLRENQWKIY